MQGRRGVFDSFPETVDLNQGSVSNNSVSHNVRSFSGWDMGESSSGANLQNQVGGDDGLKMEHARSSSFSAYGGVDTRLEERRFEPSNILLRESTGVSGSGGPLTMQGSSSNPINLNVNLNTGYAGDVDGGGLSIGPTGAYPDFYKFGGSETEHSSTTENIGTSSGNSGYFVENDGGSGSSSLVNWGSSCKRKALEGTSGQSHPGNNVPPRYNASSTLSISSPAMNSPNVSPPELLNPRIGGVASDVFPPLSVAESSARNFGPRVNLGHQESHFNLMSTGQPGRHSNVSSRPLSYTNYLDSRSSPSATTNSNVLPNPPPSMHVPIMSRNMLPFPWNGALNPRSGSSSSSVVLSGERNTQRNNIEHPMFVPPPEMRNLVQDPTNWGLATGNSSTAGGVPSSSRIGPSSGVRPFPTAWIPHHNPPTQSHQRLTEFSPWSLFPPVDSESGGQRNHFTPLPSGPSSSSSEESMMSSGANSHGHHSLFSRSALLMEVPPADDVNGWHVLAAGIEGRQRLVSEIRQVLNAMRRGEILRAEDHMLIDPFINGVAELNDRHRDMRLDVDNMSYEELLALEERIGNVSTGLSEETILESMQQQKHFSITEGSQSTLEPCCICQENYCTGDDIGTLDCGHDFHTNCIKQWLTQKNLCPICKTTALNTGEGG